MIRWSYLLPRLTILATILLFVALALDPLLRWALITAGQAALGAKVDIAALTTVPKQARLNLQGIQAANPKSPLKNLVELREANLQLDPRALVFGRIVVRDGSLTGLKFNTDRESSGAIDKRPLTPEQDKAFRETLEQWLDQFLSLVDKEIVDQFETVVVAQELVERWPQEYQRVEGEIDQIRDRAHTLRDTIEQAREKPLDHLPEIQMAIQQATELRNDLVRMRRRVDQIQQQFRDDRKSIELARDHDIERIEKSLRLVSLDQQAVTNYLLGPELAPYALQLTSWLQWGKKWLDVAGDPPRPARGRGEDVIFPRHPQAADWLVERLLVSGETTWNDERTRFKGVLTGLSSDQAASGSPTRFVAQLSGVHPAKLELLVDHRGDTPIHRLTVDCPALELGRHSLGREEFLVLDVDEGKAHVTMLLEMRGRTIDGHVIWKQDQLQASAMLADRFRGPRANRFLKTALQHATDLNAALEVHGTLDEPQWKVSANLGPQLADGINRAIVQELEERRDELVGKMQLKAINEVAQLEKRLNDKQQEILARLNLSEQLVQQLEQIAGTGNILNPVRRVIDDKIQAKVSRTIEDSVRSAETKLPPIPQNWRNFIR